MILSIISTWPLFFGLALIMIGNGIQLILIGLRASTAGYIIFLTGIIMAGYFLGTFIGPIFVPRTLSEVGHLRTFGALAAIASASALLHVLLKNPLAWSVLRFITGFCYGEMYIVVESWLNEKATNERRCQIFSIYMIITMAGLGAGQLISGIDDSISIDIFLIASVLVSLAVVPVLITAAKAPEFEAPEWYLLEDWFRFRP